MQGQPDTVSFGPRPRRGPRTWRRTWLALLLALLACLGVIAWLALLVVHRDDTVASLRAALRDTSRPGPAASAELSGSAIFALPGASGGSFSIVAVAVRTKPASSPLTWLFVYGQRADPGQRYGLIEGMCGGQYVASSGVADGTADRNGNLTIAVPGLVLGPQPSDVWFMLYRWRDGAPLGGVLGPLTIGEARTFRSAPPCS